MRLTLRGADKCMAYYAHKGSTFRSVNQRIIQNVGRFGFFDLVKRTPVFSGDLLKSLRDTYTSSGNTGSVKLAYNERDRLKGHRYVEAVEYGRPAAVAKNSPKQWMRFWKTPNLGSEQYSSNADRNIVFRKNVGPAQGNFMVRDTKELVSKELYGIAQEEVERWLRQ